MPPSSSGQRAATIQRLFFLRMTKPLSSPTSDTTALAVSRKSSCEPAAARCTAMTVSNHWASFSAEGAPPRSSRLGGADSMLRGLSGAPMVWSGPSRSAVSLSGWNGCSSGTAGTAAGAGRAAGSTSSVVSPTVRRTGTVSWRVPPTGMTPSARRMLLRWLRLVTLMRPSASSTMDAWLAETYWSWMTQRVTLFCCPPRPNSMGPPRSEEHTSELQSLRHLVCRCRALSSFPTRRSSDLLAGAADGDDAVGQADVVALAEVGDADAPVGQLHDGRVVGGDVLVLDDAARHVVLLPAAAELDGTAEIGRAHV